MKSTWQRFQNLDLAKNYATRVGAWIFEGESGSGYIVIESAKDAKELHESSIEPIGYYKASMNLQHKERARRYLTGCGRLKTITGSN